MEPVATGTNDHVCLNVSNHRGRPRRGPASRAIDCRVSVFCTFGQGSLIDDLYGQWPNQPHLLVETAPLQPSPKGQTLTRFSSPARYFKLFSRVAASLRKSEMDQILLCPHLTSPPSLTCHLSHLIQIWDAVCLPVLPSYRSFGPSPGHSRPSVANVRSSVRAQARSAPRSIETTFKLKVLAAKACTLMR